MFANLLVSQIVILAFVGVLIATAVGDIRRLEIPNRYCAAALLLYPIYVLTAPYAVDWKDGAIVGTIALVIGFLLYCMRLAGGGDVKFFSVVAVWAGTALLDKLVFVTALVGGVVAMGMLIHRRLTGPKPTTPRAGLGRRLWASLNTFIGGLIVARSGAAAATPSGPSAVLGGESSMNSQRVPPVGTLPYGAAISVGGIVVAAMLLMRG